MSPSRDASSDGLKRLRNPFLNFVLGNPLDENPSDVPEINVEAFNKCLDLIDDVRAQQTTQALLLFGEPGAGKTHLLSRLRGRLERDKTAETLFIPIRMVTSAGMLWRFLRRHLAVALLRNRSFARVITRDREEIAEQDRNLGIVLGNLLDGVHYADSAAWLRGQELPDDALKSLGIASAGEDDEQEAASRNVISMLCSLAEPVPFVFCFDQLEGLRAHQEDTAGFFKLGQIISDLHDSTHNVALISCLQTSMVPVLETVVQGSDRDRMLGRRAGLRPLTLKEAMKLVEARLATLGELDGRRPIKESDLKDLFEADGLCLARKVVVRCQELFRKWVDAPEPVVRPLPDELDEKLRLLQRTPRVEDSDAILRAGLTAVLRLRKVRVAPTGRANKVLEGMVGDKPSAVAICNQRAGQVLIRRLEMAEQEWKSTGTPALVLLRDVRNGIGVGAAKTRAVLERLEGAGARLVSVKPEALAVLEAISRMLANARSGDLTYQGDSVPAATVEDWLRGAMPAAVEDLVEEIAGDRYTPPDELAGMLMDLLGRAKVIESEEAARELGRGIEDVDACARRNPTLIGLAGGSRRVLYRIVETHADGDARD